MNIPTGSRWRTKDDRSLACTVEDVSETHVTMRLADGTGMSPAIGTFLQEWERTDAGRGMTNVEQRLEHALALLGMRAAEGVKAGRVLGVGGSATWSVAYENAQDLANNPIFYASGNNRTVGVTEEEMEALLDAGATREDGVPGPPEAD